MIEIGRLCIKIAGRDAGQKCLVIEIINDNTVMIDGNTRRKNCNIKHLEPLEQVAKLKQKASHADVVKAMTELGIPVVEKKETKKKEVKEKPRKTKKAAKKKTVKKEKKKVKTKHHTEKKPKSSKKKHQKKTKKVKKTAKKK